MKTATLVTKMIVTMAIVVMDDDEDGSDDGSGGDARARRGYNVVGVQGLPQKNCKFSPHPDRPPLSVRRAVTVAPDTVIRKVSP